MPTRSQAANKVYDAIVKLLLAYDTADGNGKANITRSLKGLYAEYAALKNKPGKLGQPYSVLTKELKQSAAALKRIADDTESLANGLVTATEILTKVAAVLALIA